MKKFLSVVFGLIIIAVFVQTTHAQDTTNTSISYSNQEKSFKFSYNEKEKTATIEKYIGNDSDINIPETVIYNNEEYAVHNLAKNSFSSVNANSVTIPSSVKYIEQDSFTKSKFDYIMLNGKRIETQPFLLLNNIDIHFK